MAIKKGIKKVTKEKKKAKKVVVKKSLSKALIEAELHSIVQEYLIGNDDIYFNFCIGHGYDYLVFKKLDKIIKTVNQNNIFMIHEKCEATQIIVPIFITVGKDRSKDAEHIQKLKDFGCHFVHIKKESEIAWKLEAIQ